MVVLSVQHQRDVDERRVSLEAQRVKFEHARGVRADKRFNRTQSVWTVVSPWTGAVSTYKRRNLKRV